MRILYLTQWFEPEPNIIKGLRFVRALQAEGHRVTVVTGLPNYPTGRLYPGYRLRWIQRERIGDVDVIRLPLYPSHDHSSLRRSLNFLSFFASALLYLLLRRERYDMAYVYHPPITVGLAAALAGLARSLPFVLDVQDLWPDTLSATGMAGTRWLTRAIGAACRLVYRRADAIVLQSDGMRHALETRGVPPAGLHVIRNWAMEECLLPGPSANNGRFRIVYAGNLGTAQGLKTPIDAMVRLAARAPHAELLFYGSGVEEKALRARAKRLANVRFMGRVAQEMMPAVLRDADALLLHLADHPLFSITIPSKVQAYLAAGRPILAGVAGEAADLLKRSGAALVVPPGDDAALAAAMAAMSRLSHRQRRAMGARGREFYAGHFSFAAGIDRTIHLLRDTYPRMTRSTETLQP